MATIRQQRLAAAIINNANSPKPLNKKELLVSAGYDETTAKATPALIMNQKGVQQYLHSLGFNPENAKRVVAEILNDETVEPSIRIKASQEVFKVSGEYAPEKHISIEKHIISIDE